MSPDCFLGLDCGTQSAKAGVWTVEGKVLGRGAAPLEVSNPRPGWAEQDPRAWWTSAVLAIRSACAGLDPRRIAAVGVAWQRESFTLVDEAGEPLRPGILWLDIRAHREADALAGDAELLHRETGKPLDVTLTLPRLQWLRAHEPELFRGPARWVDVGSWLLERLTGRRATSLAGADTAGLVGLASRAWSPVVLERAGLAERDLPELLAPGAVAGGLSGAAAGETGLPPSIPVVAAGGDGQVLAVGLGCVDPEAGCTLTLGTSVVLGVPGARGVISPFCRTLFAASPEPGYLLEAVIQSGTFLFRWLDQTLHQGPAGRLAVWEEEARSLPEGSEGLVTVPHWWGTRFPRPEPEARGATLGWSHRHGGAHLYRSLLEGVAFELRHYLAAMTALLPGGRALRVSAGGGGAGSRLWRAIIADVLGCVLAVPEEPETVALGAAMLACLAAGGAASLAEATRRFVRPGSEVAPEPQRVARYSGLYDEVYVPLREAAVRLSGPLARLAGN